MAIVWHYFLPSLVRVVGRGGVRFIDEAFRTSTVDAAFLVKTFPTLAGLEGDGRTDAAAGEDAQGVAIEGSKEDANEAGFPRSPPTGIFIAIDRSCRGKEEDSHAAMLALQAAEQKHVESRVCWRGGDVL